MGFLDEISQSSEARRKRWALGLSVALTAFIFVGYAGYKGIMIFGNGELSSVEVAKNTQTASAVESLSAFESSGTSFKEGFKEVKDAFGSLKSSMENVFVPFITGIEVYERE